MISIEGEIVSEGTQPTFLAGLGALFATFFVFNLEYPEEATCTLEFIQRWFLGLNPERGTKAAKGKVTSKTTGRLVQKKQTAVNPRLHSPLPNHGLPVELLKCNPLMNYLYQQQDLDQSTLFSEVCSGLITRSRWFYLAVHNVLNWLTF
ncbi:hypothetical protein ILYODFUR_035064 [Ilyodon furcidens]|uniref:Uncharacterized protein n=1 Tax=Ilyodon furcidens TaxID=33524 RepID=A0ABV0U248_9TELE